MFDTIQPWRGDPTHIARQDLALRRCPVTPPPQRPKIYHITHVDNLANIVQADGLSSDAEILRSGGPVQPIGMSTIKRRRLEELEVGSYPGSNVGDYVPFYFCPRSVMLYVIYRANHPELSYRDGQDPIVHLEADFHRVVDWATTSSVRWAFSLSNAGAYYTEFRSRVADLNQLDWNAIMASDFRDPDVKERKQAEFLIHERFPLELVERIGVRRPAIRTRAENALATAPRLIQVDVRPEWYF